MELLLDQKKHAINNLNHIDWHATKYIVINFQTNKQSNQKIINEGRVKYGNKVLTKQIIYFAINLSMIPKIKDNKSQSFFSKKKKINRARRNYVL